MVLVVGGSIALLLAIGVVVFMFKYSAEYNRVQSDLQTSLMTLERLHQRDPFPNTENVERMRRNQEELENYRDALLSTMAREQIQTEDMERAAFPAEIERVSRRLRRLASERDVRLAEGMAFGFDRYAAGNLPMQEHVPRLVTQLRTIERLCTLLFDAGISELRGVEREVFDVERTREEVAQPTAVGRRGRTEDVVAAPPVPVKPEGVEGLYSRERYTLTFLASDEALRDTLNDIIASPVLMVVRNLELRNEMALGGTSAASRLAERLRPRETQREPGAPREPTTTPPRHHEDRVVAGRERIRVVMEVDVYQFEHEPVEAIP